MNKAEAKLLDMFADDFLKKVKDGRVKAIHTDGHIVKEVASLAIETFTADIAAARNDADSASNKPDATELEKAIAEAKIKAYEKCLDSFTTSLLAALTTIALQGGVDADE